MAYLSPSVRPHSLFLALSLCVCLCLCLSMCVRACRWVATAWRISSPSCTATPICVVSFTSLSLSLCVCVCVCADLRISLHFCPPSVSLCVSMSVYMCACLPVGGDSMEDQSALMHSNPDMYVVFHSSLCVCVSASLSPSVLPHGLFFAVFLSLCVCVCLYVCVPAGGWRQYGGSVRTHAQQPRRVCGLSSPCAVRVHGGDL